MIRTRDFLLFVVSFIFIVVGIGTTLFWQQNQEGVGEIKPVEFSNAEVITEGVLNKSNEEKQSIIAYFKQKILAGEGDVPAGEPTFTSVDDISEELPPPDVDTSLEEEESNCVSSINYDAVFRSWPQVVTMVATDKRSVVVPETSTSSDVTFRHILDMPISPNKLANSVCATGAVIGVTPEGRPLYNYQASEFQNAPAGTLVGYALDGFPIYGPNDYLEYDTCGGTSVGSYYQYRVRSGDSNILHCYYGTPVKPVKN